MNNGSICGREEVLVTFLYGELSPEETETFQRHLASCSSCNNELRAFKNVRSSVAAWRNEFIGQSSSPAVPVQPLAAEQQPSAWAAIRAFFDLSPVWMKGSLAFASVVLCLLAVLAVFQWNQKPAAPIAQVSNEKLYTAQEVQTIADQRVQEALAKVKPDNSGSAVATSGETPVVPVGDSPRRRQVANSFSGPKAQRPLSRSEREDLATDLRLAPRNDFEINLLGDTFND